MKTGVYSVALIVLSWLAICQPLAAEDKPVLLVSTSALEEMMGDISYIAEALGFAEYGQMTTMFAGQYSEGLDASRPVGFMVRTDGEGFQPLGIFPVKNLREFLAGLENQVGEPEDAGDGVLELSGPAPIYLKEHAGWAFIAQSVDDLAGLPDDPIQLLQGLNKTYDLSVKAFVQNIPQEYRDMAMEQIKEGVAMSLENLPENEENSQRRGMIENSIKQWESMMKGIDQLTLGFKVDAAGKKIVGDSVITAVDGTKVARQMATFKDVKTQFAGFCSKASAFSFNSSTTMLDEDIAATSMLLKNSKTMMNDAIDDADDIPNEEMRKTIKELAGVLVEVMADTIQGGHFDLAGSLKVEDGKMTWVSGMQVVNGGKIEAAIKKLAADAGSNPDAPKFELAYDQHAGVRFHKVSLAVPEDEDEARRVLGDTLDVVIGISSESAYVAAGADADQALRKAIDGSSNETATLPYEFQVALTPLAKYFRQFDEENDGLAAFVAALESASDDKIVARSKPIEKGIASRLEIAEGVLRAIGEAVRAAQGELMAE